MSLFRTKEWWYFEDEAADETSGGTYLAEALVVAPFRHVTGTNSSLILTGSLSGTFRAFDPSTSGGGGGLGPADCLLFEAQLKSPILQLEPGCFSGSGGTTCLAVLHPKMLSVYTIQRVGGEPPMANGDVHASVPSRDFKDKGLASFQLGLLYQHRLSRLAFSLTVGRFGGGASNKDLLCVQSVDGAISVFEHESYAFSQFLPGFLLPKPLLYIDRTDSFVAATAAFDVQSFSYRGLATAEASKGSKVMTASSGQEVDVDSTKRVIEPDWTVELDEEATELCHVPSAGKDVPGSVVVLCRRSLHILQDVGVLQFSRKVDFSAYSLLAYRNYIGQEAVVSLVSTDSDTLYLFRNSTMQWATQVPFAPVAIQRASFYEGSTNLEAKPESLMHNFLVIMSKAGDIFVGYLGTNPSLHMPPVATVRPVNYAETDEELKSLTSTIKGYLQADPDDQMAQKGLVGAPSSRDSLTVSLDVKSTLERCLYNSALNDGFEDEEDSVPMARVEVTLRSGVALSGIRVTIDVNPPLAVTQKSHFISTLSESYSFSVYCYLQKAFVPSKADLTVVSVHLSDQGAPTLITAVAKLPLNLMVRPCAPVKEADLKVTIGTNKPAVSLQDLFPEFVIEDSATMASAAGFQHFCGPFVTVLSSKTSQRYRLQSDSLPALWLLLEALEARLQGVFSLETQPLEFSYSANLPLQEYFSEIDAHFACRQRLAAYQGSLGQMSAQLRAIQKRLLTKFKDKNPAPLVNLDSLMEGSYKGIMETIRDVERCQQELDASSSHLSAITSMLIFLLKLAASMTAEEVAMVQAALSPVVQGSMSDQGWEDTTDAALTYLLRTSLAKPGKENQGATPISLKMAKDSSQLKKHITTVIDRINRGGRISDQKNQTEASKMVEFGSPSISEEFDGLDLQGNKVPQSSKGPQSGERQDDLSTPAGTRFGESGERARSAQARHRLTRPVGVNGGDENLI